VLEAGFEKVYKITRLSKLKLDR